MDRNKRRMQPPSLVRIVLIDRVGAVMLRQAAAADLQVPASAALSMESWTPTLEHISHILI